MGQLEDQHDVKFIVDALQSPIPSDVIAQAQAIDDQIMSKGETQGQKVYLVTDKRAQALNSLVRRLLLAMGQDEREWVVRVLDTQPPTINAFVFGGKYIYVYTGLLKEATSYDELAVVLGHELGHSLLKHNLRKQQDTTNTLAGLADIIGALAGGKKGYEQVTGVTKALRASYSRTDEEEADALGVAIAKRAGFDPLRGADFFGRMARHAADEQAKTKQQFSQLRGVTEQALAQCQQWVAAANANPLNRNRAQAICNDAEQKRLYFNQQAAQYQSGLRTQQIYADHPSDQNRIAAIAALTDYVNGRRALDSLQRFQQSYRVMAALNQTDSVLLKRQEPSGQSKTLATNEDNPADEIAALRKRLEELEGKKTEESKTPSQSTATQEARIRTTKTLSKTAQAGRTSFNGKGACFGCHGTDGDGMSGLNPRVAELNPKPSNLRDADGLRFKTVEEVFTVIKEGIKGTAMIPVQARLTDEQIYEVIAYLQELQGK